jgi:Flagellar assembly protein FliH
MSEVRPLVLPVMDDEVRPANWLEAKKPAPGEVEPLLDRLTGQNSRGQEPRERVVRSIPSPPRSQPEPDDEAFADESGEQRISRLPPPPGLGALVPGGRSNAPPANDAQSEKLDDRIQAFGAAAVELAIARAAVLATTEGQLLDLAIAIAAALIEHEVERDPELHSGLVRAALNTLGDCSRATLRTSPDAFEAIRNTLGGERSEVDGVRIDLVADSTIPGLGCVVDAEHVRVDATVAERLRSVRIAFEDERRRKVGGSE